MKFAINSFKAASYAALFKLSGLIKVSFLLGSQMIWFSGINCVLPLSGAFGGVFGATLLFLSRQILHIFFFKTVSLKFLAFCIPGFFASLYWTSSHWSIRVLLPILCMSLFIAHPVGGQAFLYSFYWLIPVALYFVPRKSVFLTALGSTFIAHAVGSVIWCYTVPMTAPMWMALMPIVALERMLFALGMMVAYYLLKVVFKTINIIAMTFQKKSLFIVLNKQ